MPVKRLTDLSMTLFLVVLLVSDCLAQAAGTASTPQNLIFFGRERSRISEANFLETGSIVGAQLKYTWKELEPVRDKYELALILSDLAFLQGHGKVLFIQLQDVSFADAIVNVPEYLREDPIFNGGAARQYAFEDDEETNPVASGWVARRWDPAVRGRFIKLLHVLGEALDGRIEGISLPETSIEFGESGAFHPPGFTYDKYMEGLKIVMTAAGEAFPQSQVIQYANFMPGEWLPGGDRGYLKGIYQHADQIDVGVGGPDILPHRKWQQKHSYPLIAQRGPDTKAGVAVQWGNLADTNPTTGEKVTVA